MDRHGPAVLLERDAHLAELSGAFRDAATGRGSVVLVAGEAGAGKTSLVRAFAAEPPVPVRVLWGVCDDLVNPRPLGPFLDMLPSTTPGGGLPGATPDIYGTVMAELTHSRPTVVVVEDAQWADAATLDVIRFIGRRVADLHALMVVTHRTEEVPADHPLRVSLGLVPAGVIRRIDVPALSMEAVAHLAGRHDVARLYQLTAGNPFLVQEVLAAPDCPVPVTVQDAVMARVSRLGAPARASVEVVAAVPGMAEQWLLDGCGVSAGAEQAVRAGVLSREGETVAFHHELARQAVRSSVSTPRWRQLNAEVLGVLVAHDADPARLAHHAIEAGRADAIVRHAPNAARRAQELGAYAQASDYYRRSLEHARLLTATELVGILEGYADVAGSAGRWDDARNATARAVALCRSTSDRVRLGWNLCRLADVEWAIGHGREAEEAIAEAVSVLEAEPVGEALVRAYSLRAKFSMVDLRFGDGIAWGERAVKAADEAGLVESVHAMVTIGTCRLQVDRTDLGGLLDALSVALDVGDLDNAARAYVNLASICVLHQQYDEARTYIDRGLEFIESHDLFGALDYMLSVRARWHLDRGHWSDIERDRLASPGVEATGVALVHLAAGLVQARRGDDSARETLGVASAIARRSGATRIVVPAALAQAELAWLSGDLSDTAAAVLDVVDRIRRSEVPRWLGEASLWLHRAGAPGPLLGGAARPYALLLDGRWGEAAEAFTALGLRYEAADALAEADDPGVLVEALASLHDLGAAARAAMVRRRLAAMGVSGTPRGPQLSTRSNPAGLTLRQVEVLVLMASDLTYRQIAERLHVSSKTVDHHASAVRTKLGARSRAEAVAMGRRLGLITP